MKKIKVGILGASGRMGQQNTQAVIDNEKMMLVALKDKAEDFDSSFGLKMGTDHQDISFFKENEPLAEKVEVVIDFSHPSGTMPFLADAVKHKTAVVIGTTGFTKEEERTIKTFAEQIPIVKSGNFSMGINLLMGLVKKASETLDMDYNIEIVEQHHNQKVDAPSGTALMLAQSACEGRKLDPATSLNHHREGQAGKRLESEVGVFALRGGGVVGVHDVYFMGETERIQLSHMAQSREAFSGGVLKAVEWVVNQKPGLYSMLDVLGLNQ